MRKLSRGLVGRRGRAAAILVIACAITPSCAAPDSTSDSDGVTLAAADPITDISLTPVKEQLLGSCWNFTAMAWMESLHTETTGVRLDLSESYLTYWDWFEKLTSGRFEPGKLETGGTVGNAFDLIRRYGLMTEAQFIADDAGKARSSHVLAAFHRLETSLKGGKLRTAVARRNRGLVRAELDRIWDLSPEVAALLTKTFGAGAERSMTTIDPWSLRGGLRHPTTFSMGTLTDLQKHRAVTLDEVMGTPSPTNADIRSGQLAWTSVAYPTSGWFLARRQRDFYRKIQRALHAGLPVPVVWRAYAPVMPETGRFKELPTGPIDDGWHASLIVDYQVTNVPGFGTLEAGSAAPDLKALSAALEAQSMIEFFRVKNSWGPKSPDPSGTGVFAGYNDVYLEWLTGPFHVCDRWAGSAVGEERRCLVLRDAPGIHSVFLPRALAD